MFEQTDAGVIVRVHAQPGAKRDEIVGEHNGMLKISIRAKADKGKANQALLELLALRLGIAKSKITVLSGFTSRQKRFLISAASLPDVQSLINPRRSC